LLFLERVPGQSFMEDIQTHLKKIRSDAAECLVLGTLAPDGKQAMFTRIAEHLNSLAMDLEKTMATPIVNPGGTWEKENVVINAPPHPGTAVRPHHYLRWVGIVVLGVVVSGTLLGWLTERTSLDRYWSLLETTHQLGDPATQELGDPATRDNPNQMLTALVSTEQVERKALSERLTALAGRLDNLGGKIDNLEKASAETAKLLLTTGSTGAEAGPPAAEINPAPVVDKLVSTAENHMASEEAAPAKQSDAVGPRGCTLFRSFDIKSGTYVTLDGRRRPCR
jgi:BA14K-like protein